MTTQLEKSLPTDREGLEARVAERPTLDRMRSHANAAYPDFQRHWHRQDQAVRICEERLARLDESEQQTTDPEAE